MVSVDNRRFPVTKWCHAVLADIFLVFIVKVVLISDILENQS